MENISHHSINQLAEEVHQNAVTKGFYERHRNIGEMIALMHSELSEALEADRLDKYLADEIAEDIAAINNWVSDEAFVDFYRQNVKGTFEEEMADIVIRVMDMCAWKGIDLEQQILAKMRYNSMREKYHGKKY